MIWHLLFDPLVSNQHVVYASRATTPDVVIAILRELQAEHARGIDFQTLTPELVLHESNS